VSESRTCYLLTIFIAWFRADRVLVLDGARARSGDHAALLACSPMYRDLVGHWQTDHDPGASVCVTSQPAQA
jgi:hypothetical protein